MSESEIPEHPLARRIRRVRIIGAPPRLELGAAGREFHDLLGRDRLHREGDAGSDGPAVEVSLASWSAEDADPSVLDRLVRAPTEPFELRLVAEGVAAVGRPIVEVLTRCQGMLGHTNAASATAAFGRVLAVHRDLHELDRPRARPLVEADYWHALDTWQWVLRLAPTAGIAVQLAALLHDVERLVSEPERRIEQHAHDYQAFKDAHAREGARLVARCLADVALPRGVVARTIELVAHHERPGRDPELALLNDADALSFFSLNTPGFLDYFGPAHTRTKIAYTLQRLRARQHWRLSWIRLRADVRAIVRELLADAGDHPPPAASCS